MDHLIFTNDGSHSIFSKEINENYHSKHGAISESIHVFIKNGLEKINEKNIDLLEIGFGTGLNAFLSQNYLEKEKIFCNYQTNIKFDIIYFDAFSPEKQAEMWSEEILNKMFDFLKCGGFLVTYCAKGIIKRRLQKVGFKIISLPGPTGKREMTMAMKK